MTFSFIQALNLCHGVCATFDFFFCLAMIAAVDYRVFILMLPCVAACDLSHNWQENVTCQKPDHTLHVLSSYWLDDMLHKIHVFTF